MRTLYDGLYERCFAFSGTSGSGADGRGCSVDFSTKGIVTMTRCSPYRPLLAHQFRQWRYLTSG